VQDQVRVIFWLLIKGFKMKVKGLGWWVLGLVVLITIINYLDRGTLNYMWVANKKLEYRLVENPGRNSRQPFAMFDQANNRYALHNADGTIDTVEAARIKVATNNKVQYIKRGGIAIELGLVDAKASEKEINDQSKKLYSYIYMFFMVAYGFSQLFSGRLYDRIGTRKGFIVSVIIWGLADMFASAARGMMSLTFFRVMLGLGEAGPWPGAVKSNAEWFPVKQRAFAQGLFGAGGSIGSVLAPIVISMLYLSFGWRSTFLIVGSLGLIWIIPWMTVNKRQPEDHPWITDEEKQLILAGRNQTTATTDKAKSWKELLRTRSSYAVLLGRFFLDPIWWMFVAWLPIYLSDKYKLDIKQVAFSAWVPYAGAAIGAIVGGWFSGRLIRKGMNVLKARKTAVVVGACLTLPAMIATAFASTSLVAVLLMAVILGGFQFSIVNIQTIPSDLHTGKTVGSLAGIGGAAAVLGIIGTMYFVPYITQNTWLPFFMMGAALVPLCVFSVYTFLPKNSKFD
jgi:MFS transporter, ACS family, hexuronate transporter